MHACLYTLKHTHTHTDEYIHLYIRYKKFEAQTFILLRFLPDQYYYTVKLTTLAEIIAA